MKNFFLVIPTRERKEHLLNLLFDLNAFSAYISNCVIVDQSLETIKQEFKYEDFNYPIEIISGDNQKGVNHSRNLALKRFKNEEFLFFLDDDLRIRSDQYDLINNFLNENSIIGVLIPGIINKNGHKIKSKYKSLLEELGKPSDLNRSGMRFQVSSGLCIIRRETFAEIGFKFDEKFTLWGDDWDLGLRLLKNGTIIYYNPSIQITHLHVAIGGQRDKERSMEREFEILYLKYYLYKKHFSKKAFREFVVLNFIEAIYVFSLKKIRMNIEALKKLDKTIHLE